LPQRAVVIDPSEAEVLEREGPEVLRQDGFGGFRRQIAAVNTFEEIADVGASHGDVVGLTPVLR
jgi:hypothetical protein